MEKKLLHVRYLLKYYFSRSARRIVKWNKTRLKRKVLTIVWNSAGKYFNDFSLICETSCLWRELQYTWERFNLLVKRIENEFNIKLSRDKTKYWETVDDIIKTVEPMVCC